MKEWGGVQHPEKTSCGLGMGAREKLPLGSYQLRLSFKFLVLFELQS